MYVFISFELMHHSLIAAAAAGWIHHYKSLNFKILSDAGHTHDWRYSVEYTERLSHWPYWLNTAMANFKVTKTMPDIEPQVYAIESSHKTCFFKGLYCCKLME